MISVAVNPRRELGQVDQCVFGGFVEHVGRCVYGGIYDAGSPLSDDDGFRGDVLELLRDLRVSVLRWPGGNFASNYHWTDGIGPKDARPSRPNLAWGGVETNEFGTDEFLRYCGALGAKPYICLNMGTGSLDEALAWVEYCNSADSTEWAQRRRANGRNRPYRVRYWALGNEMYGDWQVGVMSAREYVATATKWARAIRAVDPDAVLVSCGMNGWDEWDRIVIDGLAGLVDLHSLHIYTAGDDHRTTVLHPHQAERGIRSASALIQRAGYRHSLPTLPRLAYDEWNVYRDVPGIRLEERYGLADALAVATYLNIFVRNSAWVGMANIAQLVNAIAPVVTTPKTVAVQPIYYPILLHGRSVLPIAVDSFVDGPTIDYTDVPTRWSHRIADLGPFPVVDSAATMTAERDRVTVTLVNRDDRGHTVDVSLLVSAGLVFDGPVRVNVLTGERDRADRVLPDVESAVVAERTESPKGASVILDVPARSFTVLEGGLTVS